jgi:hypothetical protein
MSELPLKRKNGPFLPTELACGQEGLDILNKRMYYSPDGRTIISLHAPEDGGDEGDVPAHTHDSRYYTEAEVDALIAGRAASLGADDNYVTDAEKAKVALLSLYEEFYVPAGAIAPRSLNGAEAATLAPFSTNSFSHDALKFDSSAAEYGIFSFRLPKSWNLGTLKFKVDWTAESGSGGIAWVVEAFAAADGDQLSSLSYGTAVTVTDTALDASDRHTTAASGELTIGNTPAEGDLLVFQVSRNPAHGSDTLAVDGVLLGIMFQFVNNASNTAW